MKLLLCIARLKDITAALKNYSIVPQRHDTLKFLYSATILHHEVTILETGFGIFQTAYKTTKALSSQKYHLALKLSLGNAYKQETRPGAVLNIVNDKPGDYGAGANGEWRDLYDLELINRKDEPQQHGGFVNLNNSYLNVFLPFKKVVGLTVNHYGDKNTFAGKRELYKADCETGDGLGFVYPCMYEKQNYYQLCVIERNLATGEHNAPLALDKLNETLINLLQKL